ncbi:MAG: PH domain-containing protein [Planctomycetaceae bacterium]
MSVQAIAGVSPTSEARIMTEFPSVGATGIGRLIGSLMDSVPAKICGIKISYIIFGLPLAPLGALLFLVRLLGARYILTNRSVQIWAALGTQRTSSVDLNEIASVEIEELPGQAFFRAADIKLKAANGQTLLRLSGVADAAAFGNVIQRAIQARRLVQSTLSTINARK